MLQHTEEVDVDAEEGVEDVADLVEVFLYVSGGEQVDAVDHEDALVEDHGPQLLLGVLVLVDPVEVRDVVEQKGVIHVFLVAEDVVLEDADHLQAHRPPCSRSENLSEKSSQQVLPGEQYLKMRQTAYPTCP